MLAGEWREVWLDLRLTVETFETVGLPDRADDAAIWRLCREKELVLITGNRNDDGPLSLEATLRSENTLNSLPVLTLADPQAAKRSPPYADRVVERLLEYLIDIEKYRGAGRLYFP